MRLLTFSITSPFGTLNRLGVELGEGAVLDANLAYAFKLTERDRHPKAQALADVLVPAKMMELINNLDFGGTGWSQTKK